MYFNFDILNHTTPPNIYLANPNRKILKPLNGIKKARLKAYLRDIWEIDFEIDKYYGDHKLNPIFEQITHSMEIHVDTLGWFRIDSYPTISYDTNGRIYKTFTAYGYETTLIDVDIVGIDINCGTETSVEMYEENLDALGIPKHNIQLYIKDANDDPTSDSYWKLGLLNILEHEYLSKKGWSIGDIDIAVSGLRGRQFMIDNQNVYSFLTQDAAASYKCLFWFDRINKTVNATKLENLGNDMNLCLTLRNMINSIAITDSNEKYYTRFRVAGADNEATLLAYINYGSDRLENLDYAISTGKMDSALSEKYQKYIDFVDTHREDYAEYSRTYMKLQEERTVYYELVPIQEVEIMFTNLTDEELDTELQHYQEILNTLLEVYGSEEAIEGTTDYSLYVSVRDVIIPKIELEKQARTEGGHAEKDEIDWKTNWELYGINELEIKLTAYQSQVDMLEEKGYNIPWSTGIETEAFVITENAKTIDENLSQSSVVLDFDQVAKDSQDLAIFLVGSNTSYSGSIWLDNISVQSVSNEEQNTETLKYWDFEENIDGWHSGGEDWESNYNGELVEVSHDNGKLKVKVDYSKDADKDCSQVAVCYWNDEGLKLSGANRITLDVVYETSKLDGVLKIKASFNETMETNQDFHTRQYELYQQYLVYIDEINERLTILKDKVAVLDEDIKTNNDAQKDLAAQAKLEHEQWGLTDQELSDVYSLYRDTDYEDQTIEILDTDGIDDIINLAWQLYESAKEEIEIESHPQLSYEISLDNLFHIGKISKKANEISMGDFCFLELDDGFVTKQRVIGMEFELYNFSDTSMQIEFSDMVTVCGKADDYRFLLEGNGSSQKNKLSRSMTNYLQGIASTTAAQIAGKYLSGGSVFPNGISAEDQIKLQEALNGLVSGNLSLNELRVKLAKIDRLEADCAFIKYLEVKFLTADHAEFKSLKADVATINTILGGTGSFENGQFINLTADNVKIDSAVINDLIAKEITALNLQAGSIEVSKNMQIISDNGKMTMNGEALQIAGTDSDGNDYVAIQLGYNTQNNPSLIIRNETGAVMLDAQGLHEDIVPDGLIKNDMIANGTIDKNKFSFIDVQEDPDGVMYVADVYVNSKETSAKYVSIRDSVDNLSTVMTGVETRINGVEGSITDEVWKASKVEVQDENGEVVERTIKDILVKNTIDINGISSRVSSIETNTEVGKLTQLEQRVGQLEINEKEFKTEVSKTYLQATDVSARNLLRNSKTLIYEDYAIAQIS